MTGASGNSAVVNAVHPSNQYARSEIVKVLHVVEPDFRDLLPIFRPRLVVCALEYGRFAAAGNGQPALRIASVHVILLSWIVPLATASSAANAEILSESSMQSASRIAVIFLNFML